MILTLGITKNPAGEVTTVPYIEVAVALIIDAVLKGLFALL